jgi:hypothetical protein
MTKANPLIYVVKENDVVFFNITGFSGAAKQLCRVYDLKLIPADEVCSIDWLEFKVDVLYASQRMHPSVMNNCIGNCLAMQEIVPEPIMEMFAKNHNMWKADEYMMSDAELEAVRERFDNLLEDLKRF